MRTPSVLSLTFRSVQAFTLIAAFAIPALLAACAVLANAQTAHFNGAVTTQGSGFTTPTGVELDQSGSAFVADHGHNAKRIPAAPVHTRALQMYAALPMSFEANAGQTDPRVKFLAHAPNYSLFLLQQEAVFSLLEPLLAGKSLHATDPIHRAQPPQPKMTARSMGIKFVGGNAAAVVAGNDELPSKTNYFIGNDPKQWHTNVPNYSAVKYTHIYPGVDAVFHGDSRRFEFDFDIAPGADPHSIALEVDGARKIRLDRAGDLMLGMDEAHQLVLNKPHVYQALPQGRRDIAGSYVLGARNRIAFAIGPYDHTRPLVIDPTLVYSTYLGGNGGNQDPNDLGKAIAVDSYGDVYVAGPAGSVDFPVTAGAYDTSFNYGQYTAFVSKLNPSGSALIYSTFLGSTYPNVSTVSGIALDASGDAYLTGYTNPGYPTTPGAFITSEGSLYGSYAFVTELNPTGTGLVYSTYLSGTESTGSPQTYGFGIAADAAGNAYVVGTTNSQTYATTPGAYQTSANCTYPYQGTCTTAFVTKVKAGGASLSYSTYLGTGGNRANAIAIDSSGDAFVVGNTTSDTFPVTPGAFMTSSSSDESLAFVTELNPTGTALVYSTFLAGSNSNTTYLDDAYAVAVDASGYAYVTGTASDSDFPTTPGAYQRSLLDYSDAFVTKFNFTGSTLVYSTYLPGLTTGYGIGVNSSGEAYVAGDNFGNANDFPTTPDALQTSPPTTSTNGFLTVFNSTGSGLVYSTYIGQTSPSGNNDLTVAWAVALDSQGNAYVTGSAPPGFPTTSGAYKTALAEGNNAFIMEFALTPVKSVLTSPTPGTVLAGPAVTFAWNTAPNATGYTFDLGTTVGGKDLYGSGATTATSVALSILPTNGENIYARLYTHFATSQSYIDYIFTAATRAALTSPAPNSVLAGPSVTFTWSAASAGAATGYTFDLGTTVGGKDLYGSGATNVTSVSFTKLPTNGETLYVRLFTNYGASQAYTDYVYTAASKAVLTSPAAGTLLRGPNVTFTWSAVPAVTSYTFDLGTTLGGKDLFGSGAITATTVSLTKLPTNGETIYARLFTHIGTSQTYFDYTFTAATRSALTSPAAGTVLAGPSVHFAWSAASAGAVTGYTFDLGTTVGAKDIFGSGLTSLTGLSFNHLPTNGETIYARLYTDYGASQAYTDYVFTAASQAVLTTPTPGSTLTGASATFTWSPGSAGATGYTFDVGTTVGGKDIFGSGMTTKTSFAFSKLPTNGATIHVRLITFFGVSQVYTDYVYTAAP